METAIVIPILLLILVMMVDLGRMIYAKIILTNAAREGAYYLAYHPEASIEAVELVVGLEAENSGIAFAGPPSVSFAGCCTVGQPVTVTVSATVDGFFVSGSIIMSNPATMMVQK